MNGLRGLSGGRATGSDRARELVLAHGWNATAYQVLNPGIDLWFTEADDAVVGFVDRPGVRVAAGAPLCAADRIAPVAAEFERASRADGRRVAYFGVERRFVDLLPPGHASIVVGAQPVWSPSDWPSMLEEHASLRQQLNRARNKGVTVHRRMHDPAADDTELRTLLHQWLSGRGLPPLHFLVEPRTFERLDDRMVFVAVRDHRPVGFLVASPIPLRSGWLVEQIVRGRDAPNGTAELLIDAAIGAMRASGARMVTLGLAPLSHRAGPPAGTGPIWLRVLFAWTRAHVHRFYNFEGLEAFKAKFRPATWEPVFLAVDQPRIDRAALHAVAGAFSGGSVSRTIGRAIAAALRQEAGWAVRRFRH